MRMPNALASVAILSAPVLAQAPQDLLLQADRAYAARQFAQAASGYEQAFRQDPSNPSTAYNAACSHALAGHVEAAFQSLERALVAGFAEAEGTAGDPDLAALHGDARWPGLLERMRARAAWERTFWDAPALTSPDRDTLTEDERIAGLSRFWSEVKFNFVDPRRLQEVGWDALYLSALPRVRAAQSTAEYYRVLSELCARLKDGHTNVFPSRRILDRDQARPLLKTRRVEGRVLVTAVSDPALKAQGIAPGMEVVSVDGEEVTAYAQRRIAPFVSASTSQDLDIRAYSYALLSGPRTEAPLVGFKDGSGRILQVRVPRTDEATRLRELPNAPAFSWRMLPGGVALVTLGSFGTPEAADRFLEAFPEIAKARAVILDVRDNGGGNSGVGLRILQTLARGPIDANPWISRDYKPTYRAWGRPLQMHQGAPWRVPADPARHYGGPVAMLIGPATYSAAEDFAVQFDAMRRGPLVGEATGGSTGQPLVIALPGGGRARICTRRDTYPDGRPYIGVGVQPTLAVPTTVADVRSGRDAALEAALAVLAGPYRAP